MSNIFKYTKLNVERTIQGLLTKEAEFIYLDTGSRVPKDKTYSVYYLIDKSKHYFTNIITSKYVRQLKRIKNFECFRGMKKNAPAKQKKYLGPCPPPHHNQAGLGFPPPVLFH